MPAYTLTVNGERRTVEAAEDTPLLWVIRDLLNLTGTKYGCGAGLCRACTVHLDGEASFSCQIPITAVGERRITTIEGLSPDRSHPLQQAWIEEDVPQCGYCQPGQIMSAAALLDRTPAPSETQIDEWMKTNLCRCGTYTRIRSAILRAAAARKSASAQAEAKTHG